MSNTKKFTIPSADEVLKDDNPVSVKKYFRPGTILREANIASTSGEHLDPSSLEFQCENVVDEPISTTANLPTPEKDAATSDPIAARTVFESAFSTLKESKYYETPAEQASKPIEKIAVLPKTKSIIVNIKQKGNPLLKHIKNVPWEFGEIEPDYIVGETTCALFLSVKYHNLFPNYIHERLKTLGKCYQLRVLLLQLDTSDPYPAVRELQRIAILTDLTLMCAWSAEEAGKYLETYKMFEGKSSELIMEKQEAGTCSQIMNALASVKSVNQTDALTLLATFGSLEKIVTATPDELALCPGMGPNKAKKLFEVFHLPFLKSDKKSN